MQHGPRVLNHTTDRVRGSRRKHHFCAIVDPLWGRLEMTPEGRRDFFPKVNYD
jgi:hypothetical protein